MKKTYREVSVNVTVFYADVATDLINISSNFGTDGFDDYGFDVWD